MEPSLMTVGLNYRTAPLGVRERFWMDKNQRQQTLFQLSRAEGIEEVIVLATCHRTEFWLWANDVTLAANSVMRLLGADFGLKLGEWKHFYRLLDEAALLHIFRVASSLDSMVIGEPRVDQLVREAWVMAQQAGGSARFLDAVLQKAVAVAERVRNETAVGTSALSIASAAIELARQNAGSLIHKHVVLLGASHVNELAAQELIQQGAGPIAVISRTPENASEMAARVAGCPVAFDDRLRSIANADILISSTTCPHTVLGKEEIVRAMQGREQRPLLIIDIAMPRDIDPAVRNVEGVSLSDLDDLETVADEKVKEREAAAAAAQKILQAEARGFCRKLLAERVVPTIVALRQRLDEFCRQELDAFRTENGPFSRDQDEMLNAVMSRMTQRIAGSLARELRELPEKVQQEQMTTALQRLFHLKTAEQALAGTRLEGPGFKGSASA